MKLVGIKWGKLEKATQEWLLKDCDCVNAVTVNDAYNGDCIVDLTENLSIDGKDYYFDNINCDMKHDQYVKVGYGKYGMWYWTNSDGSIDYNYSWLPGGI